VQAGRPLKFQGRPGDGSFLMIRIFSLSIGMLIVPGISAAQADFLQRDDPRCETPIFRQLQFSKIDSQFDALIADIEGVSPEDWKWFDLEIVSFKSHLNSARFQLVTQHRLYRAYRLRNAHKDVKKTLIAIAYNKKQSVSVLADFLGEFSKFTYELKAYFDADENRQFPILSKNQKENTFNGIVILPLEVTATLKCFLQSMPE
jgi:hypothetical protein